MRKFAIFYNNGEVVYGGGTEDEEVSITISKKWLEAPNDGVSHIISEVPDMGRLTLKDYEYYYQMPYSCHGEGDIGGSMKIGVYLRQIGLVKFGGWTSNKNFRAIAGRANLSKWIPQVSARKKIQNEDEADE